MAYANSFINSKYDNRPLFGYIVYNLNIVKSTFSTLDEERNQAMVALHEIIHILAMSPSLYMLFVLPETN